MTKHFDIPREKIAISEIEDFGTEPLKDGDTTAAREVVTFLFAVAAAVALTLLIVLINA